MVGWLVVCAIEEGEGEDAGASSLRGHGGHWEFDRTWVGRGREERRREGRRGNLRTDGAMMEGRGKVSLASSFYSAAATRRGDETRRATRIDVDVDFSHSGRSGAMAVVCRQALTRERARFNQLPLPPSLPPSLPSSSLVPSFLPSVAALIASQRFTFPPSSLDLEGRKEGIAP